MLIGPDGLTLCISTYVILVVFHLTLATLSKSFYLFFYSLFIKNKSKLMFASVYQVECTFCAIVLKPCVHDARNWVKQLNGERINQSHWSSDRIIQIRLVNLFSVQDVGPISCIVDTGPKAYRTQNNIAAYGSCILDVARLIAQQDATW